MNIEKLSHIIDAVIYISKNAVATPVRGLEIAKKMDLPERFFEADLQKLSKAGILKSIRGPKGGYVLAKERRNISLRDIYAVYKEASQNRVLESAINAFEKELVKTSLQDIAKPKRDKVDFDI